MRRPPSSSTTARQAEDFFFAVDFAGALRAAGFVAGFFAAAFFTVGFFALDEARFVGAFRAARLFAVERRDDALPRFVLRADTVGRFHPSARSERKSAGIAISSPGPSITASAAASARS